MNDIDSWKQQKISMRIIAVAKVFIVSENGTVDVLKHSQRVSKECAVKF